VLRGLSLLVAALFVAGCATSLPPVADTRSCAVYRTFYATVSEDWGRTLAVRTVPFSRNDDWPTGPDTFDRDTGETRTEDWDGETFEVPIREEFALDTNSYFRALTDGESRSLQGCFEGAQAEPDFFDGSARWLAARNWLRGGGRHVAQAGLWRLSPAGFSADGRYALIYAEYDCHGWCGGGSFYLFEYRGETWVLAGDRWVWIA